MTNVRNLSARLKRIEASTLHANSAQCLSTADLHRLALADLDQESNPRIRALTKKLLAEDEDSLSDDELRELAEHLRRSA